MKSLAKALFRQRVKLEEHLTAGIDILQELLQVMQIPGHNGQETQVAQRLLDLEVSFENCFTHFLDSLDRKYYLPFYWEDLFEVYTNLKKIFAGLHSYHTEKRIFKARFSFDLFLQVESRFLDSVKHFLQEHLTNRKYSQELLKNGQHLLKDFSRLYYHAIASIGQEGARSHITLKHLKLFQEINAVNATVRDLLQKILIGTSL